ISNKHPDLLANVKGGVNTINPFKSWNDDNGHGSHVAGIVAARNNTSGVVGVGPAADLYAVKVLNAAGSGYLSDVIEGIQWAMANGMQVINMSLGTGSNIQSFHDAVIAAKNAGVVVVAAAGNSGGSVIYPAAYSEAIAVSATDRNNVIASWSSRGPEIDLAAPGVSIYSTYKGTGYATLSGTSMAAPHVAGSAALVLNTPVGGYDVNLNGKWDPDEVQKKLQDRAVDLGNTGFDNLSGWGLVNAYSAVQP
ncbi:MAG: S8 family peptidase, partial [Candidatus Gracilibacteria bacterium]